MLSPAFISGYVENPRLHQSGGDAPSLRKALASGCKPNAPNANVGRKVVGRRGDSSPKAPFFLPVAQRAEAKHAQSSLRTVRTLFFCVLRLFRNGRPFLHMLSLSNYSSRYLSENGQSASLNRAENGIDEHPEKRLPRIAVTQNVYRKS